MKIRNMLAFAVAFAAMPAVFGKAQIYSVPACEERNAAGYVVTVDGETAPVSAVRNSAMPVNIRWPGHQRELDQTEIDGMVRCAASGPVQIAVTAPHDFKEVKVRPRAKGVVPATKGRTASFTVPGPGFYSVEFDGIHRNLHLFVDPPVDCRVDKSMNTIYYGPGVHDVGLIELKGGQTLFIDEGAVVFGRVYARDADNIAIRGRGILDMSRIKERPIAIDPKLAEEQRKKGFAITNAERWDAVRLEFCDNVTIDGIMIRDSLCYNIRPVCCRNLTIRNVKICGNWRYNSDGIDMHNCENVRISDCFLRTFDDAICVKGFDYTMDESEMLHDGYRHDVFTNAVIERCTVWCDWGRALEFGAETRAREITDITFRDCDIIRAAAAACEVQNCDYADIHDILFDDIRVELDSFPHKVAYSASAKDFDPKARGWDPPVFGSVIHVIAEYSKDDVRRGRNRDITLRNFQVTGPTMPYLVQRGYDAEHRATGLTVDGFRWNGRDVSEELVRHSRTNAFADPPRLSRLPIPAPFDELVPVDWTVEPKEKQVKVLRRLHDEYGFRRFVLIGPSLKDDFGGATLKDFEELGDSIAWAWRQLADLKDVELGWWLAPSLRMNGGGRPDPIVNSDGTPALGNCPLSPKFTADLKAKVAACVKRGRPRIVFIEDDYTLCNNAGLTRMKGCFCPLHLKEFAARVGKAYTGNEIAALYDKPTDENRPLREAFALTCRDSLAKLAGELRAAIDSVDPTVRTCLCQSGCCDLDGDDTEAVARAFAGGTRPMVRICGASYMNESIASSLPGTTAHLFWSAQHLPGDFELIHETDPYPHTRFYASTLFLGSELCAALMAGASGSYYYCAPYVDESQEDDGYAAWMRESRPWLKAVRAARVAMKPAGVRVIYAPAEVYLRRGHLRQGGFGGLPHAVHFLAKMGIPYRTAEGEGAAVLFGDVAEILPDDEVRALLKGGVLLDGEAAMILSRRGFADLLGCTAEPMPADVGYAYEEIQPIAGCRAKGRRLMTQRTAKPVAPSDAPSFAGQALLKPKAGTEVWSQFSDLQGKGVAPSVTFCRNAAGGRVAVMALSPSYGYGFNGGTFHFRKQELIHRLVTRLAGDVPDVAAPKTPSTWVLAAKSDDELLVMVENLCGEPHKDAELAFAAKWQKGRIARLDANGAWVDAGTAGARYRVDEADYYPQKPTFFKVSLKGEPGFRSRDAVSETSLATEMRADYPAIRKVGAVSPYGEVSPFVFKGRLMRMELIDPLHGLNPRGKEICAGIRDVETGKILSTFGEDCYYFSAFCENDKVLVTGTERQNGTYAGDTIWAFESTDLVNWSRRKLLARPGWRYFNTSLTKGPDGYVLLMESDDRRHATQPFTMFFATSKDLRTWTHMDDDVCFPKHRYAGGPFIRYHNGFYYVSLVTELPNVRYATYLYRTADFRRWECGKYNPLVNCSQEDRRLSPRAVDISPELAEQIKTHFIGSASDLEMCDFKGKTYINYGIGDQQGFYYMCEAWYDGPMGELLENFFK